MARKRANYACEKKDPTTHYAQKVVDGKIVAGRYVRLTCKRHLSDKKRKDIRFNLKEADRVFDFFSEILVLSEGQFEGKPFHLTPVAKIHYRLAVWLAKKNNQQRLGVLWSMG